MKYFHAVALGCRRAYFISCLTVQNRLIDSLNEIKKTKCLKFMKSYIVRTMLTNSTSGIVNLNVLRSNLPTN